MVQHSLLSYRRVACAVVLFAIALFLGVALVGFDAHDPSYFYDVAVPMTLEVKNYLGTIGAHCAAFALYMCGFSVFFFIPLFVLVGIILLRFRTMLQEWSRLVGLVLLTIGTATLAKQLNVDIFAGVCPGGLLGAWCYACVARFTDSFIAYASTCTVLVMGTVLVVRFSWVHPAYRMLRAVWLYGGVRYACALCKEQGRYGLQFLKHLMWRKPKQPVADELEWLVHETLREDYGEESYEIFDDPFWKEYGICGSLTSPQLDEFEARRANDQTCNDDISELVCSAHKKKFIVPSKKLFDTSDSYADQSESKKVANERAQHLEKKLEMFGIQGDVVSITIGPVVTLFEYAPASDVKVSKILALEDDLALALEALSLRIIAPIPGRPVVGFEVANATRKIVAFADIVSDASFIKSDACLPLIIGRDTVGKDVVVDLTAMPHLLVAGSTGAGKSVALNAMLTSLLCRCTPDELKLILIDPKRLEFASFADIAHLNFPILTDVQRVPIVLRWAVTMMEERYDELARAGMRNVQEYQKQFGVAAMPYTVIVIDELADLMMTVGKEVEELIARLAQMARAAGIHLIIATQRPSVDVITGLIKVNFPSRIAFKVISKVDSRTILDSAGAEKLLGRGDMLFLDQKGMTNRVHGAYVKDEEINAVVNHIKKQRQVEYQDFDVIARKTIQNNEPEDPLYHEVLEFLEETDQVSISLLQRTFRIGYNRSARIIDTLEAQGVIMPADGGKMRKVLR